MPPAKFAELRRQRAGDAARPSSNTTEINQSCNPGLPRYEGTARGGRSSGDSDASDLYLNERRLQLIKLPRA